MAPLNFSGAMTIFEVLACGRSLGGAAMFALFMAPLRENEIRREERRISVLRHLRENGW